MKTFKAPRLPSDPAQLAGAVQDAMHSMEQAAHRAIPYEEWETLHTEPSKLRAGMFALADGTDWDPGEGEGMYRYTGSAWVKLIEAADVPPSTPYAGVGNQCVEVHTGNGYGATNTKNRIFTTIVVNTGTAITYATSAASGGSWTINETGLYAMEYHDVYGSAGTFGISLNQANGTTAIQTLVIAQRAAIDVHANVALSTCSCVIYLTAGDVVRACAGTNTSVNTTDLVRFRIRKIGI